MTITFTKSTFKDTFLTPISKIVGDDDSNKGCIINLNEDNFECICNTHDGSTVLHALYNTDKQRDKQTTLNIFDLKKFIRLIDCIDVQDISFTLNSNNITYTSPTLKFKYHLMDDGVIRKSVVNVNKIKALKFDNEFIISKNKIDEIVKTSVFTDDSNKIYFSCKDNKIFGELTDKTKPNIDSVDILLSEKFIGNSFTEIPISLDVIRKFYGLKFDSISVKINTKSKVIMFELIGNNSILKYIATALVK